jgi:hypothetical protein
MPKRCFAASIAAASLCLGASFLGCGRRATRADCQLIVDRSVELRMKEMTVSNPSAIRQREEQIRAELSPQIASCEGRHVTERTMACVSAASTSEQLDRCLR